MKIRIFLLFIMTLFYLNAQADTTISCPKYIQCGDGNHWSSCHYPGTQNWQVLDYESAGIKPAEGKYNYVISSYTPEIQSSSCYYSKGGRHKYEPYSTARLERFDLKPAWSSEKNNCNQGRKICVFKPEK